MFLKKTMHGVFLEILRHEVFLDTLTHEVVLGTLRTKYSWKSFCAKCSRRS